MEPRIIRISLLRVLFLLYFLGAGIFVSFSQNKLLCTPPTISVSADVTICNGSSTTLTATITGPTVADYSYAWTPNDGSLGTPNTTGPSLTNTTTATPLGITTYTCLVTDNLGCTSLPAFVTITLNPSPTASVSATNISCNSGTNNGTATVIAGAGTPTYTYLWTMGGQTTSTATGLGLGNYTIMVTDANGCTGTNTVAVSEPTALSTTVTSNNASCGNANGDAFVSVSGGVPGGGYTYLWTPTGQTASIATGLSPTTYTITVTDANNCTRNDIVVISNTGGTIISTTVTPQINITCKGDSTGSATVTVISGGIAPYTYLWNTVPVQTTSTVTGLKAGTYTISVIDASAPPCTTATTVLITEPASALVVPALTSTTVNCTGYATGSATVTPSGGAGSYTYSWNLAFQTTSTATGLTAGNYTVTVWDSNGCANTNTVLITEPASALVVPALTSTTVNCTGYATGSATVTPSGGAGSYTYSWNLAFQTTSTATGLTAGNYTVTVWDSNGCANTNTVLITEPALLTVSVIANNSACNGNNSGSVSINAGGGVSGYSYSWNPTFQTTSTATGLPAGNYTVIITDANGCTKDSAITVNNTLVTASVTATSNTVCAGSSTTLIASGGTSYLWSPSTGLNFSNISNPIATVISPSGITYTVNVSIGACTDDTIITINVYPGPSAIATATPYTINIGNQTTLTGVTSTSTYTWSPTTGLSCTTCANPHASPIVTTIYTLTTVDLNGCTASDTVIVNVNMECEDLFVPKAFSPNNDGFNDVLYVRNPCILDMEFTVYNRWGQEVFFTKNKTEGWNGVFHEKQVDPAVFFYTLSVNLITGNSKYLDGNVTLVR